VSPYVTHLSTLRSLLGSCCAGLQVVAHGCFVFTNRNPIPIVPGSCCSRDATEEKRLKRNLVKRQKRLKRKQKREAQQRKSMLDELSALGCVPTAGAAEAYCTPCATSSACYGSSRCGDPARLPGSRQRQRALHGLRPAGRGEVTVRAGDAARADPARRRRERLAALHSQRTIYYTRHR